SYYSGKSVETKINESLDSVKILNHRGFYKRALKILKKVKQLAWEYEKYYQLLPILEWEYGIYSVLYSNDKMQEHKKKYLEERAYLFEVIENEHQYELLGDEAHDLYREDVVVRTEDDLKKYEDIIKHPLLQNIETALSYDAKKMFLSIWALYHTIKKDYFAAFSYDKMQLELLEENSNLKEEGIFYYLEVSHNLLYNCLELRHYEEFMEIMEKIKAIPSKKQYADKLSFQDYANIFDTIHGLSLDYYFDTRQFDKALETIAPIKKGLKKYRAALEDETKIYLYFNVSKLLFYTSSYEESLEWVSKVDFHEKQTSADGTICYARILKLLIYYELGESYFDLLQYEIKSTRRFLQKKERLYQVEDTILKYLYRLVSTSDLDLTDDLYHKFKEALQYLMLQKFEKSASSYLNLIYWLDSKIENQSLREIMIKDFNAQNQKSSQS
ncbi:MAG: hypothetical protein ACPGVB_13740, partial [Chitinophagales bacterium]